MCLCIHLPEDDNAEVKYVGGRKVTNDYGLSIVQFIESYNV